MNYSFFLLFLKLHFKFSILESCLSNLLNYIQCTDYFKLFFLIRSIVKKVFDLAVKMPKYKFIFNILPHDIITYLDHLPTI